MKNLALHAVIVELDDSTQATSADKGKAPMKGEKPTKMIAKRAEPSISQKGESSGATNQKVPQTYQIPHRRSKFSHENSQIPEGGYFTRKGRRKGPPSDSSSTLSSEETKSTSGNDDSSDSETNPSSSSESSDTSSKRRKLSQSDKRYRKERRAKYKWDALKTRKLLAGVQAKSPPIYSGIANLDILDQWTYAMDTWIEMNGLDNKWAIKLMDNFLSDKASNFYMKHVALRHCHWTIQQVYEGLFDYCFLPDYKLELRKCLMSAYQGRKPIRDFARDLDTLAH